MFRARSLWLGLGSALLLTLACEPEAMFGTQRHAISFAQVAQAGEFSATVGLRFQAITTGVTCTGTLIAPRWVLTAAHCVTNVGSTDVAKWTVHSGEVDLNSNPSTVSQVVEIHVNPGWDPVNITLGKADVALMKLAADLPGIQPVALHRVAVPFGTTVTLAGYGRAAAQATRPDQLSGILHHGVNTTLSCATLPPDPTKPFISDARSLCFDSSSAPGACPRDSGGPAYVKQGQQWRVVAVASGARNTSDNSCGQFSIYAAVASELDFIDEVMGLASAADAGTATVTATDAGAATQGAGSPDAGPSTESSGPVPRGCQVAPGSVAAALAGMLLWWRRTLARRSSR